jgi:uncharacterized linocin/CFP29 family protein
MTTDNPQVPWTDEQWARVNQVIQEEASRARVAATFLPLVGPLPRGTDFVRIEEIDYPVLRAPPPAPDAQNWIRVDDRQIRQLATLQVRVYMRGAQMGDAEMTSAVAKFRRAANVLARLEDAVVFQGLVPDPADPNRVTPPATAILGLPDIWDITGGEEMLGLWDPNDPPIRVPGRPSRGGNLVRAVSRAIGRLEGRGHFGPFAVVLGQSLFLVAQTPDQASLVLPQDRIIPFLGGGPLLRSTTFLVGAGVVVALGGTPVELVVATDISLQFLQVTAEPHYLFRVFEKLVLRVKEPDAIVRLRWQP